MDFTNSSRFPVFGRRCPGTPNWQARITKIVVSKLPLTLQIPWGLDETQLKPDQPESEEAETAILELDDKDEPEQQEGSGNE